VIPDYLAFVEPTDVAINGPFKEMINSARAYAYARWAGIPWLVECDTCPGAHPAGTYSQPSAGAPWYNAAVPATEKFLGVIGLDVEGADNSTREVRVTPTLSTGGTIGPAYYGPRTLVVRALAIASDEHGLQLGVDWLQFSFTDDLDPCTADSLVYYDYCTDPVSGVQPKSAMRQFRGARITEGPEFLRMHRSMPSGIGACAEFEITYVTADPAEYAAA
jgi:hypothetical protein